MSTISNKNNRFSVRILCLIGVLAALVFAASWISINIPTPIDKTRIHLGNIMCLLSGMLLGPVYGGLAAGIGSMFYDFTNPAYIASAPFTLLFKFMMAFVCGLLVRKGEKQHYFWAFNWVAAAAGALTYVLLYLGKSFFYDILFLRAELQTALVDIATKGIVSTANGIIAAAAAVPLATAVRKGLSRSHVHILEEFHSVRD